MKKREGNFQKSHRSEDCASKLCPRHESTKEKRESRGSPRAAWAAKPKGEAFLAGAAGGLPLSGSFFF